MTGENRQLITMNRLKFKTAGKLPVVLEESIEYSQFNKGKPEDDDYAQKSPRTLL
jgi:hypothetical protein